MKTKSIKFKCQGWNRFQQAMIPIAGAFILTFALQAFSVQAQGDLLIHPSRIVFDGTTTSEVINLANTGQDTARYLISFVQYKMTEDGAFEEIKTPEEGQFFASDHIRYFPRNVVLAPKESQAVKIQPVKTNQLKPGEYRSHLYFRSVPDQKPLGEDEEVTDTSSIIVRLTPVFGITIPVIIRVGESNTTSNIEDLSLSEKDNRMILTITLSRFGNMSVYGNISVEYVSPEGKVSQVGIAKGVAVYTPNVLRKIALYLNFPEDNMPNDQGTLRVVYTSASDIETTTLAESDALVGQIH
jgi:hypothetical protein